MATEIPKMLWNKTPLFAEKCCMKEETELNNNSVQISYTQRMFRLFPRNRVPGKNLCSPRSMLSKELRLDRDLQDYTGLDDNAEEENHFLDQGDQEVVSLPDKDEGERQSAWADPLHGELSRLQPHRHIQWAWGPHPSACNPGNLKQEQRHSAIPSYTNQIPLTQWQLSPISCWQVKPPERRQTRKWTVIHRWKGTQEKVNWKQ